jgi:thiol-disulfide isomerase/thioredoxin
VIQVKVFGTTPPCAKCKEIERRAQNTAARYPGKVEVIKLDSLSAEGDKYTVMSTPTVVINDKVVAVGKLLSEEEIERYINKELDGAS